MYFLNRIDEQGRFYGLKAYNGKDGQDNTHGFSYLRCRIQLKESKMIMGLEKIIDKNE